MLYESKKPLNMFGSHVKHTSLGAPDGAALSSQLAEFLRDLTTLLGLRDAGVITPWAERKSDIEWEEIRPDTNIATFEITDREIQLAQETVLFGQRIPFLGVLASKLQSSSEIQAILEGSTYEWFETLAVYRQDDPNPVPAVWFFHWLRVRPEEDIPRTVKTMSAVASEMFGKLLFAQQVPVGSSSFRAAPVVSFAQAYNVQEPNPVVTPITPIPTVDPVTPTTSPTTEPAPPPSKSSVNPKDLMLPLLLGVCVAASTVYVARKVGKK